ncbi:unnamed protein product [Amoebophrya sp. A120]|nr:unnamed protein product [Amoebophrya sp. A120]|eukprot:GSA120T00005831001.1
MYRPRNKRHNQKLCSLGCSQFNVLSPGGGDEHVHTAQMSIDFWRSSSWNPKTSGGFALLYQVMRMSRTDHAHFSDRVVAALSALSFHSSFSCAYVSDCFPENENIKEKQNSPPSKWNPELQLMTPKKVED